MKKSKLIFYSVALTAATSFLSSCSNEQEDLLEGSKSEKALGLISRSGDDVTTWKDNDKLKVEIDNKQVTYTFSSNSWTKGETDPELFVWQGDAKLNVLAYILKDGATNNSITLSDEDGIVDQTVNSDNCDFLYYINSAMAKPESETVNLQLQHVMSRAEISISGIDDIKAVTLTCPKSMQYAEGVWTADEQMVTVNAKSLGDNKYEAILTPFEAENYSVTLIKSDNTTLTATREGITTFISGSTHKMPIISDGTTASFGNIMVEDWNSKTDLGSCNTSLTLKWDGSVAEGFGGGDGTKENPFLINTPQQLAYLAKSINESELNEVANNKQTNKVSYQGNYFKQTANFDMCGHEWTSIGKTLKDGSITKTYQFQGAYDGNNKVISNLKICSPKNASHLALFGYINSKGLDYTIRNLTLKNINITDDGFTTAATIGALVAYSQSDMQIYNCKIEGGTFIATKANALGGIVGNVQTGICKIHDCSVNGVTMDSQMQNLPMGGILATYVGNASGNLLINNCMVKANFTSSIKSKVGGILANISIKPGTNPSTVTINASCYSGKIDVFKSSLIGGIVGGTYIAAGTATPTISNVNINGCYSNAISSSNELTPDTEGGLIGVLTLASATTGITVKNNIVNSYALGSNWKHIVGSDATVNDGTPDSSYDKWKVDEFNEEVMNKLNEGLSGLGYHYVINTSDNSFPYVIRID